MLKLNLGAGFKPKPGYLNVDVTENCNADLVLDLTEKPWPWQDSSVDTVCFEYSLEQMGESRKDLFFVLQQLYRVCAADAEIYITSLHPRHDEFLFNPLCVHPISVEFLTLLSVAQNLKMIPSGQHYTNFALLLDVNFQLIDVKILLSPWLENEVKNDTLSPAVVAQRIRLENNICHSYEFKLKAVKHLT